MKESYTTEDIQKFLFNRGILWNGVRKNEDEKDWNNEIRADVQYFDKDGYTPAEVLLNVDEMTFKIIAEEVEIDYEETTPYRTLLADYSVEWIEFLLAKCPESAPFLRANVEKKMGAIAYQAEKEIEPLRTSIKNIEKRRDDELEYWRKIRRLALQLERGRDKEESEIIKH